MSAPTARRELRLEIEEFLYHEAWLLDEGRLYEWVDLFTEDARYWMPVREVIQGRESGIPEEGELAQPLFDDDKNFLLMRVKRLDTGLAHAEQPRSRTRHLISNIWVDDADGSGDEIRVYSNFLVFQSRLERSEHFFLGKREDRLRKVDDQWKIAHRKIVLDHTLLPRTLSILF